jgi:hypothetical protein
MSAMDRETWAALPLDQRMAFSKCRCGKEHPTLRRMDDDERLWNAHQRLMKYTLCKACEAETGIAIDRCPETLYTESVGVTSCTLPWHHDGRCVPYERPPEAMAELLALGEKAQTDG